ncbi:cytochrome P450 [Xylaria sp. FL0064]|nr:cytochrome P450 [Xylaria sp. FL0064]
MACPYKPGSPSAQQQTHGSVNEDAIVPIPQPPTHWFTGNLPEMDPSFPLSSYWRLAAVYGDIFKLDLVARKTVILSSYELINEVMDESRFRKYPSGPLQELRALLGDGLFTAYWNEENWGKAHRILMPVFGPIQIRKMFPDMLGLVSQLVLKLDRMGPDNEIVPADDFTRLAFDMIGICGFGYRFNSFYRDEIHPFAREMAAALIEAGKRANRSSVENYVRVKSAEELSKNIHSMWQLCDELVAERKRNPKPEARDLLNTMLNASDPQTGEKLPDENIRFNMVTFLVAGHETTSGTLSFLFYMLLKHPETYHKAQQEVDRVLGDGVMKPEYLTQLKYIEACIRETMRVQGPIGVLNIQPIEDTVIGGKYRVSADETLACSIQGLHHDRRVWGEDADVFRPERLLDGGWEKLPPNVWKPFGNGARACIGRFFAEQEMIIATAMILQRFQVTMVDPSYNLRLKSTLTVKPDGFKIKVTRRPGKSLMVGIPGNIQTDINKTSQGGREAVATPFKGTGAGQSLLILYGSNAGTCKYLAEDLDMAARNRGFKTTVKTMDEGTEQLFQDMPVVIITPSYEGKPADNAKKFVAWLEAGKLDSLKGVQYAVFGSGNSEWMNTFHRIPKLVDETMSKLGAKRIIQAQFVDAKEDATGPWEDWRDELLAHFSRRSLPVISAVPELEVTVQPPETADLLAGEQLSTGLVKVNKQIAGPEVGSAKKHIEIELPEGVTYEPGDYLAVLPTNPPDLIRRAATQFTLNLDDIVTIKGTSKAFLASDRPSTVIEILGTRVELATPASKRQIEAISKTADEIDQRKLQALISTEDAFMKEVIEKRVSVLDLLEDQPSAKLSFAAYLDMLRPLTPRQYSISSSPLAALSAKAETASLTYDVHTAPARSGHGRQFQGVASTYLASRPVGSRIRCVVRRSNTGFHLPADPSTPLIMVAAGTGLAPMRGFIQQRACIAAANNSNLNNALGPALLYFGCRDYELDFLYAEELREWEKLGAVEVRPAFSRRAPPPDAVSISEKGEGEKAYKYTHERMWAEQEELRDLFRRGAKIFVCGSASKLAKSTNEVVKRIWRVAFPEKSEEDAQRWLEGIREVRYVSDVFD